MHPILRAGWIRFMNPLEWGPWLYGKYFANFNPIWGYLFACTIAVGVALVAWTQIKDKYEAEHPKPTAQVEQKAIIEGLVTDYKKSHDGNNPTIGWLNDKLKDQGKDFRIQPKSSVTFIGGRFEGNDIGVQNSNPNTQFTFDGTDFINNKKGFVNTPSAQQDKKKKP
jgi:hypothetical protein